jgi:hypothetical protein
VFRRTEFSPNVPVLWNRPPTIRSVPFHRAQLASAQSHQAPSFTESLRLIWRWPRSAQKDWRQRAREAKLVEALAAEPEAEEEGRR